jgi:uncharacterized protein (TIGR00730 family)
MILKRVCVYCGSHDGSRASYLESALQMGSSLARRGIHLVYGGGRIGLMGALADAVLEGGGGVTGVIPKSLVTREIAHLDLEDLRIVGSMHERKALMVELADAFIALPGGLGTLEEFCDITIRCFHSSITPWPRNSSATIIAAWCWWKPTRIGCWTPSPNSSRPNFPAGSVPTKLESA